MKNYRGLLLLLLIVFSCKEEKNSTEPEIKDEIAEALPSVPTEKFGFNLNDFQVV